MPGAHSLLLLSSHFHFALEDLAGFLLQKDAQQWPALLWTQAGSHGISCSLLCCSQPCPELAAVRNYLPVKQQPEKVYAEITLKSWNELSRP